jgi:hypothetical protein
VHPSQLSNAWTALLKVFWILLITTWQPKCLYSELITWVKEGRPWVPSLSTTCSILEWNSYRWSWKMHFSSLVTAQTASPYGCMYLIIQFLVSFIVYFLKDLFIVLFFLEMS